MGDRRDIWKFALAPGPNEVKMPSGAKVLTAQTQETSNSVSLWAIVDPDAELEARRFVLLPTGLEWQDDGTIEMRYYGTVQFGGSTVVLHVFEGVGSEDGESQA
jgi:hypothetical protein